MSIETWITEIDLKITYQKAKKALLEFKDKSVGIIDKDISSFMEYLKDSCYGFNSNKYGISITLIEMDGINQTFYNQLNAFAPYCEGW